MSFWWALLGVLQQVCYDSDKRSHYVTSLSVLITVVSRTLRNLYSDLGARLGAPQMPDSDARLGFRVLMFYWRSPLGAQRREPTKHLGRGLAMHCRNPFSHRGACGFILVSFHEISSTRALPTELDQGAGLQLPIGLHPTELSQRDRTRGLLCRTSWKRQRNRRGEPRKLASKAYPPRSIDECADFSART
jgi:hypothetical protein